MPDQLDQIRPVSPRFFTNVAQDRGLSLDAKEAIVNDALSGRVQLENVRSQLVRNQQTEALADLRIEREGFMLSEARRRAAEERRTVETAGQLASTFDDLLNDVSMTDDEKRDAMASIRLKHADAFSRSRTLQDQYKTLDDTLRPRAKPLTFSEKLMGERFRLTLQKEQQEQFDKIRKAQHEDMELLYREFSDHAKRLRDADLRKEEDSVLGDGREMNEFKNPQDTASTIAFIREYGRAAGVPVPSLEELSALGARELLELAGQVEAQARPLFLSDLRQVGGGTPRGLDKFGLPATTRQ